jgi:glutamyl-tRNA reductase
MLNKILHRPIAQMKRASHDRGGGELVETTRKLFELED